MKRLGEPPLERGELERITWIRAMLTALRRHVDASRPVAAWRARVPRPFALEALLTALDASGRPMCVADVARALGLSRGRTRALLRRAAGSEVVAASPDGWTLTSRGRSLRGALDAAQAAALRDVARGTSAEAWADLWRHLP
jgi:hypothetical protein